MPPVKPIRVIDIAKELNLATSTIIEFLEQNSYPVERSHHSPLLPEILEEINSEYGSGRTIAAIAQLTEKASGWVKENQETAAKIRKKWRDKSERMKLKRERARRMIEGREKKRVVQEQFAESQRKFESAMRTTITASEKFDGRISPSPLDLEIIQKAITLPPENKMELLKHMRGFRQFSQNLQSH